MFLTFAEKLYGLFAAAYHRKWDRRGGERVSVPVISVGNLTVGGNGKTPFVIELVGLLHEGFPELREQNRIAVLSRGYARKSRDLCVVESNTDWTESGDEPLLIKRRCPSTLVISNADRVTAAKLAIERFGAKLILMDDGFQHRRLARDLDIVLLDSANPLGNSHLLPAGTLREHPAGLSRASVLVSIGPDAEAEKIASRYGKPCLHASPVPVSESWPETTIRGAFLLTAVARPERVRAYLEEAGISVMGHRAFRDHHAFTLAELAEVDRQAQLLGADVVLTTAKDKVRIRSWNGILPLVEIPYSLRLADPDSLLRQISHFWAT